MVEENLLILLVVLPFIAAFTAATLPIAARNAEALLAGLTMAAMLVIISALSGAIAAGPVTAEVKWFDSLQLNLQFRMDYLSLLFLGLVAGIGLLVVIYARFYLAPDDPAPRFYASLLAFAGSMSGVLLSGNIIMLVVFWELTSFMSFLLISYWNQRAEARDGARHALIVTAVGGLCLLAGMIILGQITGSYQLDDVLASGEVIRNHALYLPALVLILLGAFTKSAQFPFHFWLPGAMAAPTPVSAYLHSATLVKVGIFLLLRMSPAIGGTQAWMVLVAGTGIITMVMGAVIALYRTDLKGLLAYSTISHLGLITALIGIGTPFAITAALFHVLNHALFKAALFMSAGIIDHETGSRDLRVLSGLRKAMPITAILAVTASAAMAGLPLLNGFLSKEMFFDAAYRLGAEGISGQVFIVLAVIGASFSVAYSLRFALGAFFGPPAENLPLKAHDPSIFMWLPVAILVALCIIIGLAPGLVKNALQLVASATLGAQSPIVDIKIWHGINAPLIMSIIAVASGSMVYLSMRGSTQEPRLLAFFNAQSGFERLLRILTRTFPQVLHRVLSTSQLQAQLRIVVLLTILVGFVMLPGTEWWPETPEVGLQEALFALLWLVGGACAIGAAWQAKFHRFAAVVLMAGAGMVTCLTFVWLSAPDLAVTQLLVEIVTTVLLLLGLRWLPQRNEGIPADETPTARFRRGRDFVIALVGGLGIAAMAYAIMTVPTGLNVGDWFLRHAYAEGGGTNVVNVILVDFRAFDTFGEITVLSIVAITVFVLLRRFRPDPESAVSPGPQRGEDDGSLDDYLYVASIIMNWMFAASLLAAAYFILRGHDLPGGGFAAGVTLAIGLMLQYLATNVRWVEARLTVLPIRWIAIGLTISMLSGAGAWLFGFPFLTQHAQYINIPLIGDVPAATALIFDIGVFSVVFGSVILMLIAIAHQSLRVQPKQRQKPDETQNERGA